MILDIKTLIKDRYRNTNVLKLAENSIVVKAVKKWLLAQFGEPVKRQVKNIYVKNGTLTILCLSSVMMQELKLRQRQLIADINREIGKTIIEEIRFN